jgi:small subunit ribosomal protein S16
MSVKIRLSRIGRKKRPFFRIVAVDARKKRDGQFLENLGTFDPLNKNLIQFHEEKIERWVNVGAQCTDSVKKIIKLQKRESVTKSISASQS